MFGCIDQQGSSTDLYALSQILMNRISYRNFGTHESMVVCHTVDVNGNNRAGVRWYELRNTNNAGWVIYQEGTYAPTTDTNSRWMGGISMNNVGSIALGYNYAGPTAFPGIRYTGRKAADPLGQMTEAETIIFDGLAANGNNRYGDYSSMDVDPIDDSFWYTAECSPASTWSTRIANLTIDQVTPTISFANTITTVNEGDATISNNCLDYQEVVVTINMSDPASTDPTVTLVLSGDAVNGVDYEAPSSLSAAINNTQLTHDFVFKIYDDAVIEQPENLIIDYTLNNNGGNAAAGANNQTTQIDIRDNDYYPNQASTIITYSEDFESNSIGSCISTNPNGSQIFGTDLVSTASSSNFVIPSTTGNYIAFLNDDACVCDLSTVYLDLPVQDLTNYSFPELIFDCYFEAFESNGEQESLEVFASEDGGNTYEFLTSITGSTSWQNHTIDLNSYAGVSNVHIRFIYSDAGITAKGVALNNLVVRGRTYSAIQLAVNSTISDEQYLGPNSTVYFYDPTTSDIMLSISNTSSHDYGCTTVEVDRSGINPTALEFATNVTEEYIASKTYKITPLNPNTAGSYDLSLYYEEAEILAWENTTGNSRTVLEVVKVAGNNRISDITPANYTNYIISFNPATITSYNGDNIVTASISSGFSGFGIGKPYDLSNTGGGSCSEYFNNTWIGPAIGNWYADTAYWSLGTFPDYCDHVTIPNGNDVSILPGELGKGYTLTVETNAIFVTATGGLLDIIAPN